MSGTRPADSGVISVSLNNESTTLSTPCSVADALAGWGYQGEDIAVAVNNSFVPRSQYAHRQLASGDCIDVVMPVQGG